MEDSETEEQYPKDPTGDNDLGVEYGEMVVQSNDGNVQSSDDTEGGEGVLALFSDDVISPSDPVSLSDPTGDTYNIGDNDLEDVASSFRFDSLIRETFNIGDIALEDVAFSSCSDSFGDSVGDKTRCGES